MNRKVIITKWALALFNATTWIYLVVCGYFSWPLPDNFFSIYMGGNVFIGGAFVGGNMYEHKQSSKECKPDVPPDL